MALPDDRTVFSAVAVTAFVAVCAVVLLRVHIPIPGWLAAAIIVAASAVVVRALAARITKRPVPPGGLAAAGAPLMLLSLVDHRVAAVVVTLVLLALCTCLGVTPNSPAPEGLVDDDAGEPLQRWMSRTEAFAHWSGTTRSDWDRRVRPVLARHFEVATKANQRRTSDPAAFKASGLMLFGDLWQWVDPDNVVRGGSPKQGPGRHTLEEILERLEQV